MQKQLQNRFLVYTLFKQLISLLEDTRMRENKKLQIEHKEHFHGSDLEKIEKIYGIKKEDITSFAANVNPIGISPKLRHTLADHIDDITGYPDREYTSLRRCIGTYARTNADHIIVGNGSTELISLFIQITHPKQALILGPTYSEYEREITLGGGSAIYHQLDEANDFAMDMEKLAIQLTDDIDLFVFCNPNNPTSSAVKCSQMRQILSMCKSHGITVMIDETYVEFTENIDDVTAVSLIQDYDNVIILHGISKFFAAPGLRLGYAICSNQELLKEINERKNPWTINTLAAIAGEIMFTDADYIKETRELISSERTRMVQAIQNLPHAKVYPAHANFVLVRIQKSDVTAQDIFDAAIRKGLMIRDCSDFPFLDQYYFRFCIMMPEKNNELLKIITNLLG